MAQQMGARIVRYADDIVILCRRQPEETMTVLRKILERLGLTLNEAKTKTINAYEGKFDFLGFTIWMGRDRKTGCARFKPRALYEKYGLYKVPTTAAWGKAHALR